MLTKNKLANPPIPQDRSKVLPSLIPLLEAANLRIRLNQPNILFPNTIFQDEDLNLLKGDPALNILSDYQFSDYSMEPTALAFLKQMFSSYKPVNIVELGSGLSTALLSLHLRSLHGDGIQPRYVTIDQSAEFAQQTKTMLERVGTTDIVEMIVADTKPLTIEGRDTACYDINIDQVADALQGQKADLFIIDGPVGGGPTGVAGARFATVPLLRPLATNEALFFLDDGFRDTELEIGVAWAALNYTEVFGIKAVGKGTLVGCYID